jgi:hypothetical protein
VVVRDEVARFMWQSSGEQLPVYVVARALYDASGNPPPAVGVVEFEIARLSTPLAFRGTPTGQEWLAGAQYRAARVTLETVSPTDCSSARVAFRPSSGGSVSQDTVRAEWVEGACRAETNWTFAPTVGRQFLRATVTGSSNSVPIPGLARAAPRVMFGTSLHFGRQDGRVRDLAVDTLKVVTNAYDASGNLVTSTTDQLLDTTRHSATADVRGFGVDPVIGVDFALFPEIKWTRFIRVFLGVSAEDPTKRFYWGFSPTQLLWQEANEGVPINIQFGAQIERADYVTGQTPPFARQTRWLWGWSVLTVVDGSSLLSGLLKAFTG